MHPATWPFIPEGKWHFQWGHMVLPLWNIPRPLFERSWCEPLFDSYVCPFLFTSSLTIGNSGYGQHSLVWAASANHLMSANFWLPLRGDGDMAENGKPLGGFIWWCDIRRIVSIRVRTNSKFCQSVERLHHHHRAPSVCRSFTSTGFLHQLIVLSVSVEWLWSPCDSMPPSSTWFSETHAGLWECHQYRTLS